MLDSSKLLWLCIWLAAPAPARAGALRPARALVGHDHDHPVCDEQYRSTVCPMARIDRDQGLASPGVDRFFLPAADPLSSQPHHMQHQSHRSMHRRRRSRGSPPTPLRAFLSGPVVPVLVGPGVLDAAVVDAVDRAELAEPAPGDDAAAK